MKSWESIHVTKSSTKHPNSGHIVAEYSTYVHNSSKYNFNNLGEFSIIISSAIPLPASGQLKTGNGSATEDVTLRGTPGQPSGKTHSVLIHPDGLTISGLVSADIPLIVDLILKDRKIDSAKLRNVLPDSCTVETLPALVIIASASKLSSMKTANQVLLWFRRALDAVAVKEDEINRTNKSESPELSFSSPLLLLASELGGHRNSSTVLLLPSEDSFEFVSSEEAAKSVLQNCCKDYL